MLRKLTFPFRWLDWYMTPPAIHFLAAQGRLLCDLAECRTSDDVAAVMRASDAGAYLPSPPVAREGVGG